MEKWEYYKATSIRMEKDLLSLASTLLLAQNDRVCTNLKSCSPNVLCVNE
jgi:hypothetical protein